MNRNKNNLKKYNSEYSGKVTGNRRWLINMELYDAGSWLFAWDKLYSEKAPYAFRGYPLMLIYIGILSMAFWGLSGHTLNY